MSDFQLSQLVLGLGTFVTLIVGLYRESRARKWAMEDLKRTTAELQQKMANELKQKADEVAVEMKQTAAADIEKINGKLAEIKDTIVTNGQKPSR